MGKVKDGAAISPSNKAVKSGSGKSGAFAQFVANLTRTERYKPLQGKMARLLTTIGLAAVLLIGLFQLHESLIDYSRPVRLAIPTVLGVVIGWFIYRMVEFPPFVEFLIATEAEMNKVSWTSRDELKRMTLVVLVTVSIMAVFLFGVDFLWQFLLRLFGVLRFGDTSDLGSNA